MCSCIHLDVIRLLSPPFRPQRGAPERGASRAPEENLQVEHEGGGKAGLQRAAEGEGESAGRPVKQR